MKLRGLILIVVATGIASMLSAQQPKGVNLAAMQDWDIVVDKDAIVSEKHAAEQLQELFNQASGVKLPIVRQANRPDRHIFVGAGQAMRSSNVGFDIDDLGEEDLRIKIRDGNIAIAGGRPRGTLYGVYTFLEDYLGVRFLTADHTHVPKTGPRRVVDPVDRTYRPPLSFRWTYYAENHIAPAFAVRLRNNSTLKNEQLTPTLGGASGIRLINHTFYQTIATRKYGQAHPEYFSMVDGNRLSQVANDSSETELCLTNPEVPPYLVRDVLARISKDPTAENVSVSQNDSGEYCRCAGCRAVDEIQGSNMGSLLTAVNAVADEVGKSHPKVDVGTLAYLYSRKPPVAMRPRPNVQIMLATIECSVLQPINDPKSKMNREFCQDVVEWGKISDNVLIWNYNVNYHCYLWPVPNLRVIEPNIRFFVSNGARRVFMQATGDSPSSDFSDLRNYMICRLLWNPKLSGQQLMDEFLTLHYKKATPPIRRYLNFMHDRVAATGLESNCFGSARRHFGIDETIVAAGLEAFDEALQLADDDVVRSRVEKASISVYGAAIEEAYRWAWGRIGGVQSRPRQPGERNIEQEQPELARTSRPYVKRFFELCDTYGVLHWHENSPLDHTRVMMLRAYGLEEGDSF